MTSWGAPPKEGEAADKFFKGRHGTPWNRDLLWINRVNQEKKQMKEDNEQIVKMQKGFGGSIPKSQRPKLSGKYAKLSAYIKEEVQSITDSSTKEIKELKSRRYRDTEDTRGGSTCG